MDDRDRLSAAWERALRAWPVQRLHLSEDLQPPSTGRERENPGLVLALVLRGRALVRWRDLHGRRENRLQRGDALLALPGCALDLALDRSSPRSLLLGLTVLEDHVRYHARHASWGELHHDSAHRLPATGRHLVAALRDCRLRAADDPVLLGCTHALAQIGLEHLRADHGAAASTSEARWRHIRLLLQERCHEPLSRSAVARLVGVHPATVSVLCRRFGGAGFVDLLNSHRLARGRELLRRGGIDVATVATVAQRCGFSSSTYFGRLFKRRYGCTPNRWRVQAGTVSATGAAGGDLDT